MPSSSAYCFSLSTCWRSMMRQRGTVGPATPWMMRPMSSTATFGATAEATQPSAATAIMPTRTFLRPIRSPQRGRKSENNAAAVKNAVCVRPICAVVALSSSSIVAKAGESIDALSWKANTAVSSANINGI